MTCPKCGKEMTGVEYGYGHSERYDGVSEEWCWPLRGGCGLRIGRWSRKVLKDGENEKRYGGKT